MPACQARPGRGRAGFALCLCLVLSSRARGDDARGVEFRSEPGRVVISAGGEPVATYVYRDATITRPYFCDVFAPGRVQVTRNHPPVAGKDPTDHAALHPGIWLAFGDLSGADDWRNRARVDHDRFDDPPAANGRDGSFRVRNLYRTADGSGTICEETCLYRVTVLPGGYLLTADSEFRSDRAGFEFGDQEEMGFGVRVATPLSVKQGGRILNSDGARDERGVRGTQADWCDYSGTVSGRFAGLTLMQSPNNIRKGWFHARDYGLLVANPFGRKALTKGEESRVVVKRGEPFRLGFGVFLHSAPAAREFDPAGAYREYLGQMGRPKPAE